MNRRTEITIETHSVTIIRTKSKKFSTQCRRCGETVSAFSPEQFASFLQLEIAEICRRLETGELHLTETGRAVALICGNSEKKEIQIKK